MPSDIKVQLKAQAEQRTQEAVRQLLEENNLEAARHNMEWANLANEALKTQRRPPQTVYIAGIFALICLSLVGLSWSLKKPSNPVLIDLETVSLTMQVRRDWLGENLEIPAQHVVLDNLSHVQAGSLGIDAPYEYLELDGRMIALDQLELKQDALLEMRATDKGFSLLIRNSPVQGSLRVRQAWLKLAGEESFSEQDIQIPDDDLPPEFVRFSSSVASDEIPVRLDAETEHTWHLNRLQIKSLDFTREDPPASGRTVSSIQKGKIKLPEVGRDIEVFESDILTLSGARSARLLIEQADGALRIQFQGEVDSISAGPEGFVKNHTPTWLEYFYHHQQLAFFWSALVFLWGLLWKLRSFW